MKFIDILRVMEPDIEPETCKLHFASSNGVDDPLDIFFAGEFEKWQTRQSKRNFERDYVLH